MLSFAAQTLRSRRYGASHSQLTPVSVPSVSRGFTLVELLTVIAIIGILSAITFGVVKGVNERAAIGQAKAELGTLAQALEAYKRQYGDYPRTQTNTDFLQALIGKRGPKMDPMTGKSFIDVAQFTLNASGDPFTTTSLYLVDPWGRAYAYLYKTSGSSGWINPSYVLYSFGPDGRSYGNGSGTAVNAVIDTTKGILKTDIADNRDAADNIYANR